MAFHVVDAGWGGIETVAAETLAHRRGRGPYRSLRPQPNGLAYRPTRYGYRVMTAALAMHDDRFPDHYLAAA